MEVLMLSKSENGEVVVGLTETEGSALNNNATYKSKRRAERLP
jgi:hypothetical protein